MWQELEKEIRSFGYECREENKLLWLKDGIAIDLNMVESAILNTYGINIQMIDKTVILTKEKIEIYF